MVSQDNTLLQLTNYMTTFIGNQNLLQKLLRLMSYISGSNDARVISKLVSHGISQRVLTLLQTVQSVEIIEELMFIVSNLVADNQQVADGIIENRELMYELANGLDHNQTKVRKEAFFAFNNIIFTGSESKVFQYCKDNKSHLESLFQLCIDLREKVVLLDEVFDLIAKFCNSDRVMLL